MDQLNKSKRLRFTYNDDLTLLREVLSENPFRDPAAWEIIQSNVDTQLKKSFSIKTLKNHLQLLLDAFIKKDKKEPFRSGVEEPYCELDHLLGEICELTSTYEETQAKKRTKISKDKQLSELGKRAREIYATKAYTKELGSEEENIEPSNQPTYFSEKHDVLDLDDNVNGREVITIEIQPTTLTSENKETEATTIHPTATPENRPKLLASRRQRQNKISGQRNSALNYLVDKQAKDREMKMKELELEERKLALEERKMYLTERQLNLEEARFELERTERLEKIKLESDEKKITSMLLKRQQEFIENLTKKNYNNGMQ